MIGMYSIAMWLPQYLKQSLKVSNTMVGFISAIPYLITSILMVIIARHSDNTNERKWHIIIPLLIAAAGMFASFYLPGSLQSIVLFSIISIGIWSAVGPFWALATSFLCDSAAACGIALINSVGNIGGFIGPYLIGIIMEKNQAISGFCYPAISIILFFFRPSSL